MRRLIKCMWGLSWALLLGTVMACDEQNLGSPIEGKQTTVIGEMMLQSVMTKTQIDDAYTSDGSTGLLWSVGDKVGVFGGSTTVNAAFEGTYTTPVAKATFTGLMQNGESPLYAYYPYSEEATDYTQIPVYISDQQKYTDLTSIASCDIKSSNTVLKEENTYRFTFRSMVSLLKFELNVDGVEGMSTEETLQSITIEPAEEEVTDGATAWTGNFTMDLTNPESGLQEVDGESYMNLTLHFSETPVLKNTVLGYAAIAPSIKQGDKLTFIVETNMHYVRFTVTAQCDFVAGACYNIPLNLANATTENGLVVEEIEEKGSPVMENFFFEVSKNNGKIMAQEAYYDEVLGVTTTRDMNDPIATIDSEKGTISLCIPYLYDFTLTPTFDVKAGCSVTVNGIEQVSGESSQDFTSPVTYVVSDGETEQTYVVSISNTGLPVVVLTQDNPSASIHSSSSSIIDGYNWVQEHSYYNFLGTNIPGKDTNFDDLEGTSTIAIYENGTATLAERDCGFRIRGNSTSRFPKKPIAIKLDKKTSVLGMPEHKRWCLLAGWTDRSMIRNAVAFKIAQTVEDYFSGNSSETDATGYGLIWNPSGKHVELVLNGVHAGNYFLCEQIKIDKNRLAIKDAYDAEDNPNFADCGFLMESDDNYDETYHFMSSLNIPFMFKDDVTTSIKNTIQSYVNAIEQNLSASNYTTAYENLHINSFIDWWIVNELMMNYEYRHPKSVYTYKEGEGKLYAGPVWDFDYQTLPNISNVNENTDIENSGYNYNNSGSNKISYNNGTLLYSLFSGDYSSSYGSSEPFMWYPLLFNDATFKARVKSRWSVLYSTLGNIVSSIQTLGDENAVSDEYNKLIWPMSSSERLNYSWFIECSGDEGLDSYENVITNLINVYQTRLLQMNAAIESL